METSSSPPPGDQRSLESSDAFPPPSEEVYTPRYDDAVAVEAAEFSSPP